MLRKTKIVCTLGPASDTDEMVKELVQAGANIFRLNFSHGTFEEHKTRIERIKRLREELGVPAAILLDTKGPEIRIGAFKDGQAELTQGAAFTLTTRPVQGDNTIVSISHEGLPQDVSPGGSILLDDGLIELYIEGTDEENIYCRVLNNGKLSDRKGVNVPGAQLSLPAVTEKDMEDLRAAVAINGVDIVAASFIRKAADVLEIRRVLEDAGGGHVFIISKIENREGVTNIDEILKVSDGVMVARGDLGVEIPSEDLPLVQKRIIQKCNDAGRPVITATQMLDSMIRNPRPTRAETTDVANAILDGTDAIMLSGETAAGRYPLECVKTMVRIALRAEELIDYWREGAPSADSFTATHAVGHATCMLARDMKASAIITATKSGSTARMVSCYRPKTPIIAITMSRPSLYALSLLWGVTPVLAQEFTSTDDMIQGAVDLCRSAGLIKNGDVAIITAGVPLATAGTTNLIKVHMVGDVLVIGKGIGTKGAKGRVYVASATHPSYDAFEKDDILVARQTNNDMLPMMRRAAGIIVEDDNAAGHAAVAAMALDIPLMLGVSNATELLSSGMLIRIDPIAGTICNIKAKL